LHGMSERDRTHGPWSLVDDDMHLDGSFYAGSVDHRLTMNHVAFLFVSYALRLVFRHTISKCQCPLASLRVHALNHSEKHRPPPHAHTRETHVLPFFFFSKCNITRCREQRHDQVHHPRRLSTTQRYISAFLLLKPCCLLLFVWFLPF